MKINFQISGGFAHLPALSKPFNVDTTQIDRDTANRLEASVRESRFFDQPSTAGNIPKGAADYRTYTITVEDGQNSHTLQITDPITDVHLQRLVSQLRSMSRPIN